ncbi:hypothetical protein PoB_000647600, partial [Plakobranchus ocellatus]
MDPGLLDPGLILHGPKIDLESISTQSGSPPYINQHYQKLLASIRDKIKDGGYSTIQQREKRSILRV